MISGRPGGPGCCACPPSVCASPTSLLLPWLNMSVIIIIISSSSSSGISVARALPRRRSSCLGRYYITSYIYIYISTHTIYIYIYTIYIYIYMERERERYYTHRYMHSPTSLLLPRPKAGFSGFGVSGLSVLGFLDFRIFGFSVFRF